MPFEKDNSANDQKRPISIDVLAERLVRKTPNGKRKIFDLFLVRLIYERYKKDLETGKVPRSLKWLRRPTLLTESEEDKILWEASDAIDEAARYPKSEVPDEKIDNVKKAINKLCILLEDPRKARDLVGDLTKSDWWNARKPLFFLKGKAIQSLIAFINNLELEPLKDSVVALIPDPQEISQELDEMMVLADLEKKCEESGLNEDATRAYLLTRKRGISLAQACREFGLPLQKYEAIRRTLRRKSLPF